MSTSKRQKPKKRRKLPKSIMERPGREVMTILFGKRVMKELEKMTEYGPKTVPKNRVGV